MPSTKGCFLFYRLPQEWSESHRHHHRAIIMASNIVQCLLAMLVILHPSALFTSTAAHLPSSSNLDNPTADDQVQQQQQENSNGSGEESNIILLNNINKKIWDASSAPGLFYFLLALLCPHRIRLRVREEEDCYIRQAIFIWSRPKVAKEEEQPASQQANWTNIWA